MSPRFTDTKGAPRRLTQTTRSSANDAQQLRKSVEGLTGIGAGSHNRSHTAKRLGRILVGLLLVVVFGALLYLVAWKLEFIGGKTVPDVVGWRSARAQQVVEDAGFTHVVTKQTQTDEYQEGLVISISPDVGMRVDADSTITLEVAEATPKE